MSVASHHFVENVRPLLTRCDVHHFCDALRQSYTETELLDFLDCDDADARKVAALALGLLGRPSCVRAVAGLLLDPDPVVNQMAEHAMWSIWFRSGDPAANCAMKKGVKSLCARDFTQAVRHFTDAIESDSDFAEAYNQRAIAFYLQEDYERSAADCRKTVELMSCHFGAWAGLGHCYAHLHREADAITSYEKALKINPHLTGVRETVQDLKTDQPIEKNCAAVRPPRGNRAPRMVFMRSAAGRLTVQNAGDIVCLCRCDPLNRGVSRACAASVVARCLHESVARAARPWCVYARTMSRRLIKGNREAR